MSRDFKESDWKVLRQLRPIALDRFCRRVLDEIQRVIADTSRSSHERYLEVYDLTRRRDRELADAFNDMRRSRAFVRLLNIQFHQLLTEEELGRFSPEVRESLRSWLAQTEETDEP
jgi:mRNA degradation ribonuclease J1/J2